MTFSFFGHKTFIPTNDLKLKILEDIKALSSGEGVCFLVGGYGSFDSFGLSIAKHYKRSDSNTRIVFVTPYLNESYEKNKLMLYEKDVDEIVYPPLENIPQKFAIIYRNRYIIDNSDIVIFFVKRSFGGAYQAMNYAKKKKKRFINYAEENITDL